MRIFKSKLFLFLGLASLSTSGVAIWCSVRNNVKYGEERKEVYELFFNIIKNVNDDFKNLDVFHRSGVFDEKQFNKEINENIKKILSAFTYSDLFLIKETIKKIGVDKVKNFWFRICNLFRFNCDHVDKYKEKANHKQIEDLKKIIYKFADKVDHNYVVKNKDKINKRIDEVVYYHIPSYYDGEDIFRIIEKLNNDEKIKDLWKDMEPLFKVMPQFANYVHFLWSVRFINK